MASTVTDTQNLSRSFEELYEVEKIVNQRITNGKKEYLLKWKGWSAVHNTWESESSLIRCDSLIRDFETNIESNWVQTQSTFETETYEAESIQRKCIRNGKVEYFVKWKGYDSSKNTWEPMSNLRSSVLDLLKAYEDGELQKVIPTEETASLFDQGWVAEVVVGVIDDMTHDYSKYLVQIKHHRTNERVQKVLVPKECGKARQHVENLIKKFNKAYL